MRILVALARAADPDNVDRIRVSSDGSRIDSSDLQWQTNPFDEYALETALRLTECGGTPKHRLGEVVIVSVGPVDVEGIPLRHGLALGADRAIRIDADETTLDGGLVAHALFALVRQEQPDLVILGKQSVDTESNQVGQVLAELLDWPLASSAATIVEESPGILRVEREMDHGVQTVRLTLPAVITVDLRIVAPTSVRSNGTDASYEYPRGVRYAPLPAILKAKKKSLAVQTLGALLSKVQRSTHCVHFAKAPARPMGRRVRDIDDLICALAHEAKVV